MITADDVNRVAGLLQKKGPALVSFYMESVGVLSQKRELFPDDCDDLGTISLASRVVPIDRDILVLADQKRELRLFADTLAKLLAVNLWFCGIFVTAYKFLKVPLSRTRKDLLNLGLRLKNVRHGKQIASYCLFINDPEKTEFLLRLFSLVSSHSPGFTEEFHGIVVQLVSDLPWQEFTRWANRGLDLLTSSRGEEAVSFLRMVTGESRTMLHKRYAVLADMKNILHIYCSSLAGKPLNILELEMSGFSLKAPYTDGRSIFLPSEIGYFNDVGRNETVYTALAAHQAAALTMGTYGFDMTKISFLTELRDRYGTILPSITDNVRRFYGTAASGVRELKTGELIVSFPSGRQLRVMETDHEKFYYSFPAPDFCRELFNMIENARIEHALSGRYKGLDEDYSILNNHLWEIRPPAEPVTDDPRELFIAVLECFIQFSLRGEWKNRPKLGVVEKYLRSMAAELRRVRNASASVQTTAEVCFNIYNIFHDNFPVTQFCAKNDVRETFKGTAPFQLTPEVILDSSPELLSHVPKEVEFVETPDQEKRSIDFSSSVENRKEEEDIRDLYKTGALKAFRYPEYDWTRRSYIEKRCTLFETKMTGSGNGYYLSLLKDKRKIARRIRKQFMMMQPEAVELSRHWLDGEEIHIGDAVDYLVDLKRGQSGDEKIYFRKVKNVRDIAAAIVVDASGSTDETVLGTKIIDIETESLSLLASALTVFDDTFGIFTFNSVGPNKVYFHTLKDFDEPWDSQTQARIPAVTAYGSNRDGCAVRHACHRLTQLQNKTKLLILISDGIPADLDYGGASAVDTSQYAIEDTRRALQECRMRGIVPYCITIDRTARKYIPHMYGDYSYTILSDVRLLPEKLSRLYLKLTR